MPSQRRTRRISSGSDGISDLLIGPYIEEACTAFLVLASRARAVVSCVRGPDARAPCGPLRGVVRGLRFDTGCVGTHYFLLLLCGDPMRGRLWEP